MLRDLTENARTIRTIESMFAGINILKPTQSHFSQSRQAWARAWVGKALLDRGFTACSVSHAQNI